MTTQTASTSAPRELSWPFEDLEERLVDIRLLFDALSNSFEHTMSEMRGRGLPPNHAIVFEVGECHRAFIRLRAELLRRAGELGLETPPLDRLVDLTDLTRLLNHFQAKTARPEAKPLDPVPAPHPVYLEPIPDPEFESHETVLPPIAERDEESILVPTLEPVPPEPDPEPMVVPVDEVSDHHETPIEEPHHEAAQHDPAPDPQEPLVQEFAHDPAPEPEPWIEPSSTLQASALHVLEQVAKMKLKEPGEFAPLTACQEKASALAEAIRNADPHALPAVAHLLAAGQHPFSSLLIVVAGVGELNDSQWANHHSLISDAFGRPMGVAAARGRLSLPS